MATGFCPFAVNKNIVPGSNDPAITPRVAILHVDAGNATSLFDFFKNRSGGIESHFFVTITGKIEQYRSIYFQADANLDANDFAVSIETQGFGSGKWNLLQRRAIQKLLLWLNEEAGIPLRKVQHWNGSGVGYHTLFGAPSHWTPVAKTCPGPERVKQFFSWLVPWMEKQRAPKANLRLATFNVWVGQRGVKLRRNLRRLFKDAKYPHVIALQEAHGLKRGFWRYKRIAAAGIKREGAKNCVLLVRRDVDLIRRFVLAVNGPRWIGPKPKDQNPLTHDPRVFVGGAVATTIAWDVLCVHRATSSGGQNRETRDAEVNDIQAWSDARAKARPNRPRVLIGDWNGKPIVLAHQLGGFTALHKIDGAIVIGATCISVTTLPGQYGSDAHRPVLIELEEN